MRIFRSFTYKTNQSQVYCPENKFKALVITVKLNHFHFWNWVKIEEIGALISLDILQKFNNPYLGFKVIPLGLLSFLFI